MVPKLRFAEFSGSWIKDKISSFIKDGFIIGHLDGNHGALYPRSEEFSQNGVPYISATDFSSGEVDFNSCKYLPISRANQFKKGIAKSGDVLFAHNATVGPVSLLNTNHDFVILSTTATYFRCDTNKLNNVFLKNSLEGEHFVKQYSSIMSQSTRNQVPITAQRDLIISVPNIREQNKIAYFLSAVDDKITLLKKQYDLLCHYKKSMMQKIFSQELRFKDDNGDEFPEWEEVELKKIASKVNTKNRDNSVTTVLTNSATQGIVSQESYFEREIVTESNLTGYYVVRIGDFVYNPRISSTAPVGPIKMNELTQGVMSPLYTVFRFKKGLLKFYQYFFESSVWHDYMKSVANSGARHDRMNISGADFFGLPVPEPFEEEQTKIAHFLSAIDDKITTKKTELDKLKTWKQGLLQQMFV
ncbi:MULTISPECIES: restriction endonuclease subunit S [Enterobacterales]|uniref:restriction endonuclease subunit S n=1 Tax=Enterobacterales TaxID=91347 RepID=UPI000B98066D|nr:MULTISPECIES: restriction endonuclease subunit S [Klebsiella/Raoultella group]EIX9192442.1 restriction endonuclease subunit S [Klebsiella pneumoniae]MBK2611971.1 restriction endonuclease subunit S [Raoultella ornithinolytica]MBL4446660.1 restriction endonuclease subunit S [Klebsiella pneumoniae]MBW5524556.1 restriction endonuclease subunit S [Klebsiella pneumoniae]MCH9353920.1 restriction endonuclease subunit S [Klebsiella pneumoniae]